jgi:hypothetical protein
MILRKNWAFSYLRPSRNIQITLSSITSVDKGFMATINITAGGEKYTFKGMHPKTYLSFE